MHEDIGVIQEDIVDLKEDNDQNKQDINDLKDGQSTGDEEIRTVISNYSGEITRVVCT